MPEQEKLSLWESFLDQKTAPQKFLIALTSIIAGLGIFVGDFLNPSEPRAEGFKPCLADSGNWAGATVLDNEWIGGWKGRDRAENYYRNALTVTLRKIDPSSPSADFVTTVGSTKCESRNVKEGDSWIMEVDGIRYRIHFLAINSKNDAVELELKCRADEVDKALSSNCDADDTELTSLPLTPS